MPADPALVLDLFARMSLCREFETTLVVYASKDGQPRTTSAGWTSWYDVSKSGVIQLTRELAVEWARYGIRVNSIGDLLGWITVPGEA